MSPEDPRHGTTAGYFKHRRDGETACNPCRIAQTEYNRRKAARKLGDEGDDIALTDGRWVPRAGGVHVWVGEIPQAADTRFTSKQPPAKCGTTSGYHRHLRVTKTKPCAACKKAHARYELERQERAREAVA